MANHEHWKKAFPTDYFGHQHMPPNGDDIVVAIKDAKVERVQNGRGGEQRLVLYITADPEKWILNKVNGKSIEKLLGTGLLDEWVGKEIQLYKTKTSSPEGLVDCVRVREFPPRKPKAEPKE